MGGGDPALPGARAGRPLRLGRRSRARPRAAKTVAAVATGSTARRAPPASPDWPAARVLAARRRFSRIAPGPVATRRSCGAFRRLRFGGPAAAARHRRSRLQEPAGRPEEAWLSTALSEMLTTELAAGEKLRAIPSEDVARHEDRPRRSRTPTLWRERSARVRRNSGADAGAAGLVSVRPPGPARHVRLDLRLQDTPAGETIAVVSEKGHRPADVDGLATRAGAQLRDKLRLPRGLAADDGRASRRRCLRRPRSRAPLCRGASRAARLRARSPPGTCWSAPSPPSPTTHSAHRSRGGLVGPRIRRTSAAECPQGLRALDRAHRARRGCLVEGRYREMAQDWPSAVEIYRSLLTFFPDDLDYGLQLARAQARSGKPTEALGHDRRAAKGLPRATHADRPRRGGDGLDDVRVTEPEGRDAAPRHWPTPMARACSPARRV